MRWEYKPKTIYDRVKKRFAIIPVVVDNQWVWLETYYAFSWEDYAGTTTVRFNTYEQAVSWVKAWDEDDE